MPPEANYFFLNPEMESKLLYPEPLGNSVIITSSSIVQFRLINCLVMSSCLNKSFDQIKFVLLLLPDEIII